LPAQTQGNVNGDGYFCVNNHAAPRGLIVIIDNTVPAG
jgi:hypothetical protein